MNEEEKMADRGEGIMAIEPVEAALERELIAHYLEPYRAFWHRLPPEEQKRLRTEASIWASNVLANLHAGGIYGGSHEPRR
jgi:hypothetical protein